MAFEHHPGLAALHAAIAGDAAVAVQHEPSIEEEAAEAAELEAIAKEIADDNKVIKSMWKGGFGG